MRSKLFKVPVTIAAIFSIVLFFASCGSEKKKESSEAAKEFDEAAEEITEKVEKVIYEIPNPSEVPYLIQSTGADFNPGLTNDIGNYETYLNNASVTALNLGVYATDIGYLSSYGKTQEALNYMDVCVKMADELGISEAIDLKILERFEQNLTNTDSLASILDEAISNSDQYLNESDRGGVAALVVTGTFIEGLYIATQIIDTYPKDILADDQRMTILTPMIRVLVGQEESLNDVINLLESLDNKTEWINNTMSSLKELQAAYEEFGGEEKISSGQGGDVLSDEALADIISKTETLRTQVIEG
jgi:hypothetical protein